MNWALWMLAIYLGIAGVFFIAFLILRYRMFADVVGMSAREGLFTSLLWLFLVIFVVVAAFESNPDADKEREYH